jgi:hypothetical protein
MPNPAAIEAPARPAASGAFALARAKLFGVRPVSRKRRAIALSIALAADAIQLVLWPAFAEGAASPVDDVLDVVVGAALWMTLGMSPRLAFAFAMELVPGADLFPTWTAVVASIPVDERAADPPPAAYPGENAIG